MKWLQRLLRRPEPPVGVRVYPSDASAPVDVDDLLVYLGRRADGMHQWQATLPIDWEPGRHKVTVDLLPARTTLTMTYARARR